MTEQHMRTMMAYHYNMVLRLIDLPGMNGSKAQIAHVKAWEDWTDALYRYGYSFTFKKD